jgi:flagellum-specific peptidoglycan hydrolase FlgJ
MQSVRKPRWQQVTAVVSLSAGGAITGFSFVPRTPADIKSPTGMPIRLLALEKSAQPAPAGDAMLRSAIVNVTNYYLRMAAGKTPAEMEAIIWQHDSVDGVDHGASCAAFASLTLELASQVVGQQSWVTGGTSYPWPLQSWADVRVNPNPASLKIVSVRQDAEAHHRWHQLGDGYQPQPGDWVLFNGHIEVITKYAGGVLHTVGGDSLPNFTVNAHEFPDPLGAQGVIGFVNNGTVRAGAGPAPGQSAGQAAGQAPGQSAGQVQAQTAGQAAGRARDQAATQDQGQASRQAREHAAAGQTAIPGALPVGPPSPRRHRPRGGSVIPGIPAPASSPGSISRSARHHASLQHRKRASAAIQPPDQASPARAASAAVPGLGPAGPAGAARQAAAQDATSIPGLPVTAQHSSGGSAVPSASRYSRHHPSPPPAPVYDMTSQQAFIAQVAPGAIAAERRYGVPASVTIAQAIDESGWGRSYLASKDHNLFGIKGAGPAGSDPLPTQEYEHGHSVTRTASFRVYQSAAQSIDDHGRLLATSGYYSQSMASRQDPDAFAAALTGIYATDPEYGAKLVRLMQRYNLYRYDTAARAPAHGSATPGTPAASAPAPSPPSPSLTPSSPPSPSPAPTSSPPSRTPTPAPTPTPTSTAPAPTPTPTSTAPSRPPFPSPTPSGTAPPSAPAASGTQSNEPAPGAASIPGIPHSVPAPAASGTSGHGTHFDALRPYSASPPSTQAVSARRIATPTGSPARKVASRGARTRGSQYRHHMPPSVATAFIAKAKLPLIRAEPLYRDVASYSGIRWELLAACDWMQCEARPRYSPVYGEKMGSVNSDGTMYPTRSAALERCAGDLVELAWAVYRIDLTRSGNLSVRDLANVFAAFRWGGLLRLHHTSAMEFPYSVAGLTDQHLNMRWPNIAEPNTPDRPGARFRMAFGAVPVVLSLNYPAVV